MENIKKIIKLIISRYSPIWVFGSFEGVNFFHNSKALFLFCQQIKKPLFPVWITKNRDLILELRSCGFLCYHKKSFLGKFFCLFARYHISDWGIEDINKEYFIFSKHINLWHGVALKANGLDVKTKYQTSIKSFGNPDIVLSCSSYDANNLITAFNLKRDSVKVTGLPRNDYILGNVQKTKRDDIFYNKIKSKKESYKKAILYLPTFDDSQSLDNFSWINDDFNNFLHENNIVFFYKKHPADNSSDIKNNNFYHIEEISDSDVDLYPALNLFDLLITDYSSIFFDFALTKKRIIIFLIGKDDFSAKVRNMYFDITDPKNSPGDICYNINDLKKSILSGKNKSELILKKYHKYNNNFCQRVFNFINSLK